MTALKLESSAFLDGKEIPRKHGYKNGNIRPQLTINGIRKLVSQITSTNYSCSN